MKKLLLILVSLSFHGCVTPPGQLKDEDFNINRYSVSDSIDLVSDRYEESYRQCGGDNGIPVCKTNKTTGSIVCDVYVSHFAGTRSEVVLGRVDMIPTDTGTNIEIRVVNWFSLRDFDEKWKLYIAGDYAKACM